MTQEIQKNCGTCRNWDFDEDERSEHGFCAGVLKKKQNEEKTIAYVESLTRYPAHLRTEKDFSCSLWEERPHKHGITRNMLFPSIIGRWVRENDGERRFGVVDEVMWVDIAETDAELWVCFRDNESGVPCNKSIRLKDCTLTKEKHD